MQWSHWQSAPERPQASHKCVPHEERVALTNFQLSWQLENQPFLMTEPVEKPPLYLCPSVQSLGCPWPTSLALSLTSCRQHAPCHGTTHNGIPRVLLLPQVHKGAVKGAEKTTPHTKIACIRTEYTKQVPPGADERLQLPCSGQCDKRVVCEVVSAMNYQK